jgi:hypothetical protein
MEMEREAYQRKLKTSCCTASVGSTKGTSMVPRDKLSTQTVVETLKVVLCTAARTLSAHRREGTGFALASGFRSWSSLMNLLTAQGSVAAYFSSADSAWQALLVSVLGRQNSKPLFARGLRVSSSASCLVDR